MCKHGENIYRRRDGRYEGRYIIGRGPKGRTKFGYVYGKTFGEVRRKLTQRKAEMLPIPAAAPKSGMTLQTWMNSLLAGEHFAHLKASSQENYRTMFDVHLAPALGTVDVARITPEDVSELIALLNRKKLAQSTIVSVMRLLSSLLRAAQEEGLIQRNPCRKMILPKPVKEEQRVLSAEEQSQLRAAALATGNLPALLALCTGMRLGEVCSLAMAGYRLGTQDADHPPDRTSDALRGRSHTNHYYCPRLCLRPRPSPTDPPLPFQAGSTRGRFFLRIRPSHAIINPSNQPEAAQWNSNSPARWSW